MRNMNHEIRNPFAIFPLQGGRLCGRGPGVVRRSPFLAGMALAVVLGSMVALSTPALAMGGGGGGGGGSAPAPKVTEVNDPVAKPGDEAAGDKIVNKPDERTTEFPKPEAVKAAVEFAASNPVVAREGETVRLTLALSKPLLQEVTLSLRKSAADTSSADDVILPRTVTFPAGTTSAAVDLTVLDDAVAESDETITLALVGELLPDGVAVGVKSVHAITIPANDQDTEAVKKPEEETPEVAVKPDDKTGTDAEDETANKPEVITATVGFAVSASSMVEGSSRSHPVEVRISEALSEDVVLAVVATSGTAVQGTDYVISSGTITIPANATNAFLVLTDINDDADAANETIVLTLASAAGAFLPDGVTVGAKSTHTVTIIDDDVADEIEVVKKPEEETPEVAVKPDDDAGDETGTDTEDKTGGKPDVATATVEFAASNPVVAREGETVHLTLALSKPLLQEVTLSLRKSAADTSSADDVILPRTVTFPAGTTSAAVDLTVLDDAVAESDETITLALVGELLPDGVAVGVKSVHAITIPANDQDTEAVKKPEEETPEVAVKPDDKTGTDAEDETANKPEVITATVGFAVSASSMVEGSSRSHPVEVRISEALSEDVVLAVVATSGTAVQGTDYVISSGTITIPANATNAFLVLTDINDDADAANETIVLTLASAAGAFLPDGVTVGAKSTHTVTIIDDDVADEIEVVKKPEEETPEVVVKPDDETDDEIVEATIGFATKTTQVEVGKLASLQIVLSNPLPVDVTLTLSEYGGEDNIDFSPRTVTFPMGTTSASVDIMVAEGFDADNESVILSLRSVDVLPDGVKFGTYAHTVTIIDDQVADDVDDGQITEVVEKPAEEKPAIVVKLDADGKPGDENAEAERENIDIINEENVYRIEAENRDDYYISIENLDIVDWNIKATHHGSENSESGKISIKNATQGDVRWNIVAWHLGNNDISIENWGNIRWHIKAMHRGDGKIEIVNEGDIGWSIRARHYGNNDLLIKNVGTVGGRIKAIHRGIGDIAIENHGDANEIDITHKGAGDIRIENHGDTGDLHVLHEGSSGTTYYSGIINDDYCYEIYSSMTRLENAVFSANGFLDIDGDYEGTKETHLNFHVGLNRNNEGYGGNLLVTGEATGQSRVSLVGELIDDPSLINENIHFPDLIWVDGQAQSDTFVGEQVVGPYKYVLEYELDEDESNLVDEHSWHFNNKGLSDTAKKVVEIPDDIEKDMKTPSTTDPDKKKELGLWGGLDSSHTDIGLGLPAFVSNDNYHVSSQVQYYFKDDRTGIRALVETEYNFDVMNFRITPLARLTWTRVGFEDFVGPHRERISLVDGDTVDVRLGLSFDNEYRFSNGLGYLYGGLFMQTPIDGKTSVKVSGVTIANERNDVSIDGKLGLSYEWNEGYSVYGEASALHRDDADEVRANLGVRVDF